MKVDGGGVFHPAVTTFGSSSEAVGTPAIDSGLKDDVYLTLDALPVTRGGAGHDRRHDPTARHVALGGGRSPDLGLCSRGRAGASQTSAR